MATITLFVELRTRLIRALVFLIVIFLSLLYFANHLYTFLAQPLLRFLPQGHLIATQIVAPFFVPFKLAFMLAILLSVPFFLYQLWSFITPALYHDEKRLLWPFIIASSGLFYLGMVFAYYIIFPMLFHFLAGTAPEGVILSPDINEYLDFTVKLLLTFGGLFEIPMVMTTLVATNVITVSQFRAKRSYAIVGAFIIAMLLAPPDVLSQTLLALPIWCLYEAGILLAGFFRKKCHDNAKSKVKT